MILQTLLVALVVAAVATPLFRQISRRLNLLDHPNERSSHSVPTPRTGGNAINLAIAAAAVMTSAWSNPSLRVALGAAAALAVVGLIDDHRTLPESLKFAFQTIVVVGLLALGGLAPERLTVINGWTLLAGAGAYVLAWFWTVGFTNAYNFMDGINGMAAIGAVVSSAAYAMMLAAHGETEWMLIAVAIAGASAGFLLWNAGGTIFMGDVGSVSVGLLLATIALKLMCLGTPLVTVLLPLLPFLFDTSVTLLRRILRRERFFSAHRTHFYQRLVATGWPHLAVSGLWGFLALVCTMAALRIRTMTGLIGGVVFALAVLLHVAVAIAITARERELRRG
jgi:UDP-N-acetylmuramyl pentapeptide phosphotransferase/UDP-N-acetylglucosamine-1-phosphate transferase